MLKANIEDSIQFKILGQIHNDAQRINNRAAFVKLKERV
jgi:hypothetical protein